MNEGVKLRMISITIATVLRKSLRTLRFLPAFGICLSLFIGGCGQEPVATKPVARPVKIVEFGTDDVTEVLEYPGKVSPLQEAEMAFEVAGKIIEFPVVESQSVKKGTVLARLDPRDFKANLEAKAAKERAAKADFDRALSLHKDGVISTQDLDAARRNYEVNRADADTARKALEDAVLKAPFPGKVAKKIKKDFKNVKAKEPVLILQDDSNLEIVVNVPESDAARMRPGLTLAERIERTVHIKPTASITSIPGRTFPLRLKEFATTADPVTRTFEVTFIFDRPDDITILSGMTAKVQIPIPKNGDLPSGFTIPADAARTDESGKAFVWVVDPSAMTVRRTPVELGDLSGSSVEVTGGLKRGDMVAVSGVHQLRDGMQVRRIEQ